MSATSGSASAKDDGSDLRFVASDDKTPLKHHIEKFDSLLGEALVWVAVPNLPPSAKSGHLAVLRQQESGRDRPIRREPTIPIRCWSIISTSAARRALDSSVWGNNAQERRPARRRSTDWHRPSPRRPHRFDLAGLVVAALADGSSAVDLVGVDQAGGAAARTRRSTAVVTVPTPWSSASTTARRSSRSPTLEPRSAAVPARRVAPNGWHHLAVVAGNGQVTLYLDGASYALARRGSAGAQHRRP